MGGRGVGVNAAWRGAVNHSERQACNAARNSVNAEVSYHVCLHADRKSALALSTRNQPPQFVSTSCNCLLCLFFP